MKLFDFIGGPFKYLLSRPALIQLLAICMAGPVLTVTIHEVLFLFVFADHGKPFISTQLQIAREVLAYAHVLLGIALLAMTAGLVRGFKIKGFGAEAEIDLADDDDPQRVTTTTTVQTDVAVKPAE